MMMKLCLKFGLVISVIVCTTAGVIKYDQKQNGRYNIRVDLKNIHLIAAIDSDFIDDYATYDYAYDYADFTIKPSKPTSTPPSSTVTNSSSVKPPVNLNTTGIPEDALSSDLPTVKLSTSTEVGKIDDVFKN